MVKPLKHKVTKVREFRFQTDMRAAERAKTKEPPMAEEEYHFKARPFVKKDPKPFRPGPKKETKAVTPKLSIYERLKKRNEFDRQAEEKRRLLEEKEREAR